MSKLPGAIVANALLVMPATFAVANAQPAEIWGGSYPGVAAAETGFSRGVIPGYASYLPSNPVLPNADTDTTSAVHEVLTSLRYLPAIRSVIEAEDASGSIRDFLSSASSSAIAHLSNALRDPAREERRWEFLELLGDAGTADNLEMRFDLLRTALSSLEAGDRAAAASAIGDIGHPQAFTTLKEQLAREANSVVRALLEAKLRVVAQNASVIKTAA